MIREHNVDQKDRGFLLRTPGRDGPRCPLQDPVHSLEGIHLFYLLQEMSTKRFTNDRRNEGKQLKFLS